MQKTSFNNERKMKQFSNFENGQLQILLNLFIVKHCVFSITNNYYYFKNIVININYEHHYNYFI